MDMTNTHNSTSRFARVALLPPDGPFAFEKAYRADPREAKVNLGIGVYRDDNGQPWVLNSVNEAKKQMQQEKTTHEYLPLQGSLSFLQSSRSLLLGDEINEKLAAVCLSIQTVSGTGANSLIARFLGKHANPTNVWLPNPTWENHFRIWQQNAPNVNIRQYPYYSRTTQDLDFAGLMRVLRDEAEEDDVILFHACAHNPTGLDPSQEQWQQIAALCEEKRFFVLFDLAYQGFASGDVDKDAWAVRVFASRGALEIAVCQSFSKNLGLYGERVGALHVLVAQDPRSESNAEGVLSQLQELQRGDVSMPPLFGSEVATRVLVRPDLRHLWMEDLAKISSRITAMRDALFDALTALGTPGNWSHLQRQKGMFSYTGLSGLQVQRLAQDFGIYMLPCGRASICGLNGRNVNYVAQAIHTVLTRAS